MKKFVILMVSLAFLTGSVIADSPHVKSYKMRTNKSYLLNNCEIDIEGGSLVIEKRGRRGVKMEINENYELYVNDEQIETSDEQQKLVVQTYDGSMLIVEYVKDIGLEGVQIGLQGAKLGLKAVGGVFKMIFTSYDEDDLESDMERAAEKIERRANKLEKRADKLEVMVEDLEIVFDDLIDLTPELEPLK